MDSGSTFGLRSRVYSNAVAPERTTIDPQPSQTRSVALAGALAYDTIAQVIQPGRSNAKLGRVDERFGGCAANLAYSLSHLLNPADVAVAAFTGRRDDDAMLARLDDWGVNRASVLRQDQAQTARAYIFTEPNEHQFTYFYPGIEPDPDLWLAHLQRSLNPPEIFVQCPHRASLMRTGLRFASQHAALRLWNPGQYYETLSAEDLTDCIAHCDVLIGNKEEVDALLSSEALVSDEANLWRIVTDGSRSVTVQDPKNESAELTVEAIAQGDPTGCGDAFLAGVVGALAQGGHLEMRALQTACVAGIDLAQRCVRHLGAQSHFEEPA